MPHLSCYFGKDQLKTTGISAQPEIAEGSINEVTHCQAKLGLVYMLGLIGTG